MKLLLPAITAALLVSLLQTKAHSAVEEMTDAAHNFLAALSSEQRQKAVFPFQSDERANWHYIPKDRKGLSFNAMKPEQLHLAHALFSSALSQRGLMKATTIMSLEQVLRELESQSPRMVRDPALYYVSVFGKPGLKESWGWRLEGHHLSLNFTVANGIVSTTPSFLGSNPAEVKDGPRKGLRVLAEEEDLARALIKSLNEEQRKAAIFAVEAPKEIITQAARKVKPLEVAGIPAAKLTSNQKAKLKILVAEYVRRCRAEIADKDLEKIEKGGWDQVHFAWAGGLDKGEGHYYRVQGPTFLLEYDNTQNNNNHIHAVWRDFQGDFGEDLLRKHYDQTPHP